MDGIYRYPDWSKLILRPITVSLTEILNKKDGILYKVYKTTNKEGRSKISKVKRRDAEKEKRVIQK